jgi:hypothetical protein
MMKSIQLTLIPRSSWELYNYKEMGKQWKLQTESQRLKMMGLRALNGGTQQN